VKEKASVEPPTMEDEASDSPPPPKKVCRRQKKGRKLHRKTKPVITLKLVPQRKFAGNRGRERKMHPKNQVSGV
jgi:hypothetical protein